MICGGDGRDLSGRARRVAEIAAQVAVGVKVSPTARRNVGVITALDGDRGAVTVRFVSKRDVKRNTS